MSGNSTTSTNIVKPLKRKVEEDPLDIAAELKNNSSSDDEVLAKKKKKSSDVKQRKSGVEKIKKTAPKHRLATVKIKRVKKDVRVSPDEDDWECNETPRKRRPYKRRKEKNAPTVKKRKAKDESEVKKLKDSAEDGEESDDDEDLQDLVINENKEKGGKRDKKTPKLDDRVEQRTNIRFMVKAKRTATQTLKALRDVYGDEALSRSQVFKWYKLFTEGRKEVGDAKRAGRPVTKKTQETIAMVKEILDTTPTMSNRAIAEKVKVNKETVRKILMFDLKIKKKVVSRKGLKIVRKLKKKDEPVPQPTVPPAPSVPALLPLNSSVTPQNTNYSEVYPGQGFPQMFMYPQNYSGYHNWRDMYHQQQQHQPQPPVASQQHHPSPPVVQHQHHASPTQNMAVHSNPNNSWIPL